MAGRPDAESANPLGDYLRARRALVPPQSVGIRVSSRRRVAGLTREEVSVLAGVSVEYYTRLEQGRDRRPSASILRALSSALELDDDAAAFLDGLAREPVAGTTTGIGADTAIGAVERVPRGILELLDAWSTPAFVLGRFGMVLAAAPAVTALTPACRPGVNMFREIFLDPESRLRYVNWQAFTAVLVAGLRASVGRDVDSPELVSLVDELERDSPRFHELWRRQDAAPGSGGRTVIDHPLEGRIELQVETLTIAGGGLSLVVYHALRGSADEMAMLRVVRRAAVG